MTYVRSHLCFWHSSNSIPAIRYHTVTITMTAFMRSRSDVFVHYVHVLPHSASDRSSALLCSALLIRSVGQSASQPASQAASQSPKASNNNYYDAADVGDDDHDNGDDDDDDDDDDSADGMLVNMSRGSSVLTCFFVRDTLVIRIHTPYTQYKLFGSPEPQTPTQ